MQTITISKDHFNTLTNRLNYDAITDEGKLKHVSKIRNKPVALIQVKLDPERTEVKQLIGQELVHEENYKGLKTPLPFIMQKIQRSKTNIYEGLILHYQNVIYVCTGKEIIIESTDTGSQQSLF